MKNIFHKLVTLIIIVGIGYLIYLGISKLKLGESLNDTNFYRKKVDGYVSTLRLCNIQDKINSSEMNYIITKDSHAYCPTAGLNLDDVEYYTFNVNEDGTLTGEIKYKGLIYKYENAK
jgi:hypothetical protein